MLLYCMRTARSRAVLVSSQSDHMYAQTMHSIDLFVFIVYLEIFLCIDGKQAAREGEANSWSIR